jgi:hypothetical protein
MLVYFGSNNDYSADETMITPVIQTPGYSQLSFSTIDYSENYWDESGNERNVGYSLDGTTFMDLATVYTNPYWEEHEIILPDVDSLWVSFNFAPDTGTGFA